MSHTLLEGITQPDQDGLKYVALLMLYHINGEQPIELAPVLPAFGSAFTPPLKEMGSETMVPLELVLTHVKVASLAPGTPSSN